MLKQASTTAILFGLLSACASQRPHGRSVAMVGPGALFEEEVPLEKADFSKFRLAVSAFSRDTTLAEIDVDLGNVSTTSIERERSGVRFRFGSEEVGGYVEVFQEDLSTLQGTAIPYTEDTFGSAVGLVGARRLNSHADELGFLIPYTVGLRSGVGGDTTYAELNAGVGLGLEWNGLMAKAGLQASGFLGLIELPSNLPGLNDDFTGFNFGQFVEVFYKHADYPIYARALLGSGDFETDEIAVGISW